MFARFSYYAGPGVFFAKLKACFIFCSNQENCLQWWLSDWESKAVLCGGNLVSSVCLPWLISSMISLNADLGRSTRSWLWRVNMNRFSASLTVSSEHDLKSPVTCLSFHPGSGVYIPKHNLKIVEKQNCLLISFKPQLFNIVVTHLKKRKLFYWSVLGYFEHGDFRAGQVRRQEGMFSFLSVCWRAGMWTERAWVLFEMGRIRHLELFQY